MDFHGKGKKQVKTIALKSLYCYKNYGTIRGMEQGSPQVPANPPQGGMAEWTMAPVLKTGVGSNPPGVRIPLPPLKR